MYLRATTARLHCRLLSRFLSLFRERCNGYMYMYIRVYVRVVLLRPRARAVYICGSSAKRERARERDRDNACFDSFWIFFASSSLLLVGLRSRANYATHLHVYLYINIRIYIYIHGWRDATLFLYSLLRDFLFKARVRPCLSFAFFRMSFCRRSLHSRARDIRAFSRVEKCVSWSIVVGCLSRCIMLRPRG